METQVILQLERDGEKGKTVQMCWARVSLLALGMSREEKRATRMNALRFLLLSLGSLSLSSSSLSLNLASEARDEREEAEERERTRQHGKSNLFILPAHLN